MKINKDMNSIWSEIIKTEMQKPYFKEIINKIEEDKNNSIVIYPEESMIFNAFVKTPFEEIKVVIL